MFLSRTLGAALMAVPLAAAAAAGQSASHPPPPAAESDSGSSRRLEWIAAAATGTEIFTAFLTFSQRGATSAATRSVALPGVPTPNAYIPGDTASVGTLPRTIPSKPSTLESVTVTAPEPASVALLGTGLVALFPALRRRGRGMPLP